MTVKKIKWKKELDKIIRNILIEQAEISPNYVRNAATAYGQDLQKENCEDVFETITTDDILILFHVEQRQATEDFTETNRNGKIDYYRSFRASIIIYGDDSENTALILKSRLLSQECRETLIEYGVCIQSISNPMEIHEYKNQVMWCRTDFEINFACQFEFDKISAFHNFSELNKLEIYTTN